MGLLRGTSLSEATDAKLTELEKRKTKRKVKQDLRPYRFVYEHIKSKIVPEKIPVNIQASVDKHIPEDGELKNYFIAFLYIFPSSSREMNRQWSAHFGVPYYGNKLRVVSPTSVRSFMDIAKRYDPDIFLLSAYTMVVESIRKDEGKAYIMKITNFITEWYERYLESQTLLEKKKDMVFTQVDRNISSSENTILL